jgi:hypothetical protein
VGNLTVALLEECQGIMMTTSMTFGRWRGAMAALGNAYPTYSQKKAGIAEKKPKNPDHVNDPAIHVNGQNCLYT